MYKWLYEKFSEFYEQLQQGIFDWKALIVLGLAMGGLAFWKRKVWLRPILKYRSNFTSNRKNEQQLSDAKIQLRNICSGVSSAISDLKFKKIDFDSSVQNIKSNVDKIFSEDRRSVNLVKSKSQIELELERLTMIYGDSLSDLEKALETIQSNMGRADQREAERDQDVESAMRNHW